MKATDIFTLAKSGYSLADIKELVELGKAVESEELEKANDTPMDNPNEVDGESGDSIENYQEQIDNLTKQLDDANALINKLQDDNIKKASGEPINELAEIGKLFM